MLAQRRAKPVEVEYTVESGKLYVLQVRAAKLAPAAAITLAVRAVWAGTMTKKRGDDQYGYDPVCSAAHPRRCARNLSG